MSSIANITRVSLILVLASLPLQQAGAEEEVDYRGWTLAEALLDLEKRGLPIIFSDAVVRPGLVVHRSTSARTSREILIELLAEHDLEIRELEDGQLVVIPGVADHGALVVRIDPAASAPDEVVVTIDPSGRTWRGPPPLAIEHVPSGRYRVHVSAPGLIPTTIDDVVVTPSTTTTVVSVAQRILHLEQIVVTPAHLSLTQRSLSEVTGLTSAQLETTPHPGGDLMRAVATAPGVVQSDFSAQFNPRGGKETETLIMLDGVEIYEPFHLKDFLNVFSIVDSGAVDEVELLTGAFTAEYGDRMSAVMDISVHDPSTVENELSLGTLNSRAFTSGTFGDRGTWLVTGRGWYPSRLPESSDLLEGHIVADYYDLLVRLAHPLSNRTTAAVGTLAAYDDLEYGEEDRFDRELITARYRSQQSWIVLDGLSHPDQVWRATAAFTRIDRSRHGEEVDEEDGTLRVEDRREFRSVDGRADWSWNLEDRHLLKFGLGTKYQQATYDYRRELLEPDEPEEPIVDPLTRLDPSGSGHHAYLSNRFRIGSRVVSEVGLRWDHQDWVRDSQISPRVNVSVDLGARTELRVGWGRFFQSQRLNELPVEDGATDFHEAERSSHSVLGLSHTFDNGWTIRTVAYDKKFSSLRPRYENLFSRIELFPESRDDRVTVVPEEATARGLELVLRSGYSERASWWIGYNLSESFDVVEGVEIPRPWDQTHSVDASLTFLLPLEIRASLFGTWHSGRPTTPVSLTWELEDGELEPVIVSGPRNSARLDDYRRVDLRLSRSFPLRRGRMLLELQVHNLTNRNNVCFVEDFEIAGEDSPAIVPEEQACSPVIPSATIRWQF